MALLPVAVVSVVQGLDRLQRDEYEIRQRVVQAARATAADEENILSTGEQVMRSLVAIPAVRAGGRECAALLADAYKTLPYISNMARIDADGDVICSSIPLPAPINVKARPWWNRAQQPGFFISRPVVSPLTKRTVVAGILPLHTNDGKFDGTLSAGFDVQWLNFMLSANGLAGGAVAAIFDAKGGIIASTDAAVATELFAQGAKLDAGDLHTAAGPGGESWSYGVSPLIGRDTFVGFAMREADLFAATYAHVALDLLLPVLMLGLASLAIWIATDRQVTRWILYLRRISLAYARGHYAVRPSQLDRAPSEFRMLGNTLASMAATLQDRDQKLRDALTQKTVLIRETHHRVKNNLQIVMSLLSLQAAQLQDKAAQEALNQAQMRVNALALVHRMLHEIEDQETVDLKQLLDGLAHQIRAGLGDDRQALVLNLDILSRRFVGDIAVPLTLFAVEAMTNAFKHAFTGSGAGGWIRISLTQASADELAFTIEDNGTGGDGGASRGIGKRLMTAFARQVGGKLEVKPREGGGTRVTLIFPDPRRNSPSA